MNSVNTLTPLSIDQENRLQRHSIPPALKSAAAITLLALNVLASGLLAYYRPGEWILTTVGISLIHFYTLPLFFSQGKEWMIKAALTVSLVSLGCLGLGGTCAASATFASRLLASIGNGQIGAALFQTFILTSFIGYALPVCRSLLEKAYAALNQVYWHSQLRHLHMQLQALPDWRANFGLSNLLQGSLLTAAFTAHPSIQSFLLAGCLALRIKFSAYLIAIWSLSPATGIERIRHLINQCSSLNATASFFHTSLHEETHRALFSLFKDALNELNEEDTLKAFFLIQTSLPLYVPSCLSVEQFVNLFQGRLLATTNAKIDQFIQDIEGEAGALQILMRDFESFKMDIEQFDRDLDQSREGLSERLDNLKIEWNRMKQIVVHLSQSKQIWNDFCSVLRRANEELTASFPQYGHLKILLGEQNGRIEQLNEGYLSLLGLPTDSHNITERFQRFSNLVNRENNQEDSTPAWLFLGAERCNFRISDYEDIQQWCGIESLTQLEEKFNEIGLATEEDLYEKGIIPRNEQVSTQEIKNNLRRYIEERLQVRQSLTSRLYTAVTHLPSLQVLAQKVSRFIYVLVTSGLIAVPVLLYPIPTALGFATGMAWFALKRFGGEVLQERLEIVNDGMEILNRINLISLTYSNENQRRFRQASFINQVRIIHAYALTTLLMSFAPLFRMGIGGFLQGLGIANSLSGYFR
ncbi:hypothetical protein [Candidatus Protochlamydia phocaeensis]|uniref:hypothetical protein n=1 Tax=Candidatus Protochlamydia phocaeensis TaxID=1414722 RepID=UPI0012AC0219|nr:hypothetical protein [Candidatus Protochlamydia phocaeensis]